MPLQDHFRPPLSTHRPWSGVHSAWANAIAFGLNDILPPDYSAIANVHLGTGTVEIDVATLQDLEWPNPGNGSPAATWSPPAPAHTRTIDFTAIDTFEIRVNYENGDVNLVAAIELVSPSNKDRPSSRQAFVTKCASYLQEGISVIVVDTVTVRVTNLHNELLAHLNLADDAWLPPPDLYAVAYRPSPTEAVKKFEWWPIPLAIGVALPTLPLWISSQRSVPLDLEATYSTACAGLRMPNVKNGK